MPHAKTPGKYFSRFTLGVFVVLAALALLILLKFDPVQYAQFFPQCTFKKLTNLHCPGCGLTRALHALVHGDIYRALSMNIFFIGGAPFFGLMLLHHYKRLPNAFIPLAAAISKPLVWLVLLMTFWVCRNIPYYPFTILAPG